MFSREVLPLSWQNHTHITICCRCESCNTADALKNTGRIWTSEMLNKMNLLVDSQIIFRFVWFRPFRRRLNDKFLLWDVRQLRFVVKNVSGPPIGPSFKSQAVKVFSDVSFPEDMTDKLSRNFGSYKQTLGNTSEGRNHILFIRISYLFLVFLWLLFKLQINEVFLLRLLKTCLTYFTVNFPEIRSKLLTFCPW
jgi:hypothetical protein